MSKKNVTISDIAKELDINISTVSRALQDHPNISDATKKRVLETAQKLNYSPNNIASALARGKSNILGVIVPSTDENFFASVIKGIEDEARKHNYRVVISQSHDSEEIEKENVYTLLEAQVDGILASHAMKTTDFSHYRQVLDRKIPLIFFDRFNDAIDAHVVAIDDFKGAYQTTTHLIEQGCRKIAHIGGKKHVHIYRERLNGYKKALFDHDLTVDERLICHGDMKLENGRMFMEQLLKNDCCPDAVFSASDYSAMGALQVLREHEIDVPEQVAVAGFSNETFTAFLNPSLTSVNQHCIQMGHIAAKLFIDQINNDTTTNIPRKTILTPELKVRKSSQKIAVLK